MSKDVPALSKARARLATVLRASKEVISIDTVTKALTLDRTVAAKLLSRWCQQGWLRRVGSGLYVQVPLDLAANEQVVEDPWVLIPTLFGQCYVGGWTAAHHWELTEQLFNETVIFSARRVDKKRVIAQGAAFSLRHISRKHFFGLKTLWRGATRVQVSDPARTIVDLIAMPAMGGGIDHVADCLATYARQSGYDGNLLIRYAEQFANGAVFKRLGFLAEVRLKNEALVAACRARLTYGYARLDPSLPAGVLVTAWRLWVPQRWKKRRT